MTKESTTITSLADHHDVQTMLKKTAHSTSVFLPLFLPMTMVPGWKVCGATTHSKYYQLMVSLGLPLATLNETDQ